MYKTTVVFLLILCGVYLAGYGVVRIIYSDKKHMQLSRGFPEEQLHVVYIPLIKLDESLFGLQYWYEDGEPGPY